jgi:hypothetical protein
MIKRRLVVWVFVLSGFAVKAQFPVLKPMRGYTRNTPFAEEFAGKYDFLISHHSLGGWSPNEFWYTILAFKGNECFKIMFSKKQQLADEPPPEKKIVITPISKRHADSVLNVLNTNKFWELSNDTLAITTRLYYDQDLHKMRRGGIIVSDGSTDVFEILSKDALVMISAFEPETYFKDLPQIKQRGRFINSKRAFFELFREVYPYYFQ